MSSFKTASYLVSLYWFGALVGRLLGSWMLTKVKSGKLLGIFGFARRLLLMVSHVHLRAGGHLEPGACGFFNSIMFPNIFTLGIAGLGPMTSKGSGLIMTAIVGGAVIPAALGGWPTKYGIQHAFVIPLFCYLYIAWYGLWGSKPKSTASSSAVAVVDAWGSFDASRAFAFARAGSGTDEVRLGTEFAVKRKAKPHEDRLKASRADAFALALGVVLPPLRQDDCRLCWARAGSLTRSLKRRIACELSRQCQRKV